MGRLNAASAAELREEEDFDLPAQLTILRRAVASLSVLADASSSALCAADLRRYSALAEAIVTAFAQGGVVRRDAALRRVTSATVLSLFYVRQRLDALPARRPSRAALESIRRTLYAAIALLSEQVAPLDGVGTVAAASLSDLDRALAMRLLLSDFHEAVALVTRGRSNMSWTLSVAETELAIAMQRPAFVMGPEQQRAELSELRTRILRFKGKKSGTPPKSKLHAEVMASPALLASLNRRPDVKRHDARSLAALSITLSGRTFNLTMAANAAETLAGLRGMDTQLDKLMLELPFDPSSVLALVARRVGELRARALAS
jgi:hypothetical protein